MPAFRQLFTATARVIPPAMAGGAFTRAIVRTDAGLIDFLDGVQPEISNVGDYAVQVGAQQFLCRQADFVRMFRPATQAEREHLAGIGDILGAQVGYEPYMGDDDEEHDEDFDRDEDEEDEVVLALPAPGRDAPGVDVQPVVQMEGSLVYTHTGNVLHLAPVHAATEIEIGEEKIALMPGQALVPGTAKVIDLSLGFWRCDGAGNGLCSATAHPETVAAKIRERLERDGEAPDQVTLEHFADLRAGMRAFVEYVRGMAEGSNERMNGEREIYRLESLLAEPKGLKDMLSAEEARQAAEARRGTRITIDPAKPFIPTVDNIQDAVAIMLGDKKAEEKKEQLPVVIGAAAEARPARSLMAAGRGVSLFGVRPARDVANKTPIHLEKVATLSHYQKEELRAATRPFFRTMTTVPLEDISGFGEPITSKAGAVARLDAWLRLNGRILSEHRDHVVFPQMPNYRVTQATHFEAAGMEFLSVADGQAQFVYAWPSAASLQAKLVEDLRPKSVYIVKDVADSEMADIGVRIGIDLGTVAAHLRAIDGAKLVAAFAKNEAGEAARPVAVFAVKPGQGGWELILSRGPNGTATIDKVAEEEVKQHLGAGPVALPPPAAPAAA